MAKKKRHDRAYEIARQKIFSNAATLNLSTSYPDEIEGIVRTIKDTTLPNDHPFFDFPIDRLLRPFEEEAKRILRSRGYSTDIKEIAQLESKHTHPVSRYYFRDIDEVLCDDEVSPERLKQGQYWGGAIKCDLDGDVLNAIQILLSGQNVRKMIENNQAEEVAFEIMRLTFAAVSAHLGKDIMNAVSLQIGRAKGGATPKRKEGVEMAIKQVREIKGASAKPQEIWRYFKAKHSGEENAMNAGGYDIYYDSINDVLRQVGDGDDVQIRYNTFRQYVNPPKK